MKMATIKKATRFSGLDWASEVKDVTLVGLGGIGSWLALNLSRIGHELTIIDGDYVDITNVNGGQMYRATDINKKKALSVLDMCRMMGCTNNITAVDELYQSGDGLTPITLTGLDTMVARKAVFTEWLEMVECTEKKDEYLLIDGRLLSENMEVIAIQGNKPEQIYKYQKEYLFDDNEIPELDCTTKQTTFGAMIIGGIMTTILCNWLTNKKIGVEFREVPFYQRLFLPILEHSKDEALTVKALA